MRPQLEERIQLDELEAGLGKNVGTRDDGESTVKDAVGARVAVVHRVAQEAAARSNRP